MTTHLLHVYTIICISSSSLILRRDCVKPCSSALDLQVLQHLREVVDHAEMEVVQLSQLLGALDHAIEESLLPCDEVQNLVGLHLQSLGTHPELRDVAVIAHQEDGEGSGADVKNEEENFVTIHAVDDCFSE